MKKRFLRPTAILFILLILLSSCSPMGPSVDSYTITSTDEAVATLPCVVTTTEAETEGAADSGNETDSPISSPTESPVSLDSIPAWSGSAFIVLNDNRPSFEAQELKTEGYEIYQPLDSLGRTQAVLASVGIDTMPAPGEERGSISSVLPSGWKQAQYESISGGWLYNRCHLLGWQLSAENANPSNLITGTKYFNIEGMLPFENMIADYIKETNNHVAVRITPLYHNDNLLAHGVVMEAYSIEDDGDGICFHIFCYNVQPGIDINYRTGESSLLNTAIDQEPTNPTPTVTTTSPQTQTQIMVWIPNSGSKYHSTSSCSKMKNPTQVSKEEAIRRGFGACSKCW